MGELARRSAPCSYRHLQMIETAGRRPSPELAARLARELSKATGRSVAVSEIYTDDHPKPGPRPLAQQAG